MVSEEEKIISCFLQRQTLKDGGHNVGHDRIKIKMLDKEYA